MLRKKVPNALIKEERNMYNDLVKRTYKDSRNERMYIKNKNTSIDPICQTNEKYTIQKIPKQNSLSVSYHSKFEEKEPKLHKVSIPQKNHINSGMNCDNTNVKQTQRKTAFPNVVRNKESNKTYTNNSHIKTFHSINNKNTYDIINHTQKAQNLKTDVTIKVNVS